jgi:hypothetical protein
MTSGCLRKHADARVSPPPPKTSLYATTASDSGADAGADNDAGAQGEVADAGGQQAGSPMTEEPRGPFVDYEDYRDVVPEGVMKAALDGARIVFIDWPKENGNTPSPRENIFVAQPYKQYVFPFVRPSTAKKHAFDITELRVSWRVPITNQPSLKEWTCAGVVSVSAVSKKKKDMSTGKEFKTYEMGHGDCGLFLEFEKKLGISGKTHEKAVFGLGKIAAYYAKMPEFVAYREKGKDVRDSDFYMVTERAIEETRMSFDDVMAMLREKLEQYYVNRRTRDEVIEEHKKKKADADKKKKEEERALEIYLE